VHVSLIQVSYILGDERLGPSKGSQCLVRAGAEKLLAAKSVAVSMERVDRGEPFRDSGNASLAVGQATRTRCPASHRGGAVSLSTGRRLRCQQGHTLGLRPWALRCRLVRCAWRFQYAGNDDQRVP
jgi:hypothetical protein